MLRDYSSLCTQIFLLAVLRGQYGLLGIEPKLAKCRKSSTHSTITLAPALCLLGSGGAQYLENGSPRLDSA